MRFVRQYRVSKYIHRKSDLGLNDGAILVWDHLTEKSLARWTMKEDGKQSSSSPIDRHTVSYHAHRLSSHQKKSLPRLSRQRKRVIGSEAEREMGSKILAETNCITRENLVLSTNIFSAKKLLDGKKSGLTNTNFDMKRQTNPKIVLPHRIPVPLFAENEGNFSAKRYRFDLRSCANFHACVSRDRTSSGRW